MSSPTRDGLLDLLRRRIVVAPMAGGPATVALVVAASRAGALGWLAAGYKTPEAMAAEIAYPEINNATRPLRAAAAARGDTEGMSLWAGQGYRLATGLPAAEIIERLRGSSSSG